MQELPFAEGVARIAPCTEHCAARAAARRHRSQDMTRPPASPHLSGLAAADQLGAVTRAAPRRRGPRADLASRPALCPLLCTLSLMCVPTRSLVSQTAQETLSMHLSILLLGCRLPGARRWRCRVAPHCALSARAAAGAPPRPPRRRRPPAEAPRPAAARARARARAQRLRGITEIILDFNRLLLYTLYDMLTGVAH